MSGRLLIAGFLLAHALVHAAYLAPRPPVTAGGPKWPFALDRSWLLGRLGEAGEIGRLFGMALVAVTIGGFALAALAAIGVVPAALWAGGLVTGGVASLALLVVFFHPWLLLGVVIDLVGIWAAVVTRWVPEGLGG